MHFVPHFISISLLLGVSCLCLAGQGPGAPPAKGSDTATVSAATAATVNGQPIPEVALQRGLKHIPPEQQAAARTEILNRLIDNLILDQYLLQLRIDVPKKDLDNRMEQIRQEIKKGGQTFEKVMQELMLTEEELRTQLQAELRWEKYASDQATDKVLREVFDKNMDMFDGTMVRARHILITPPAGNAQAADQAKAKLEGIKQQIEAEVARALAKLPPDTDSLGRERIRTRTIDDTFAALARKESACPSKEQGGDLNWFPRIGRMVEPFAKAAFAMKPYEIGQVTTQFGCHLILVTDRRPGKETKFEDIKEVVKEVYFDRLREYLVGQLRPKTKIVVAPQPKS
jgi:parvulin-like peptidyl-prolyl isomerase